MRKDGCYRPRFQANLFGRCNTAPFTAGFPCDEAILLKLTRKGIHDALYRTFLMLTAS